MDWINSIGFIAASLTTASFVPQAWKILRHKKVKDLSLTMYTMMFTVVSFGIGETVVLQVTTYDTTQDVN